MKIYNLFDPVSLKVFTFDFEEMRCWLNVELLKEHMKHSLYKDKFHQLNPEYKQDFLGFLDKHEKPMRFNFNPFEDNPHFDFFFELSIYHNDAAEKFQDTVKKDMLDNIFFQQEVETIRCPANLHISEQSFPLETTIAFGEKFLRIRDIEKEESIIPDFENNIHEEGEYSLTFIDLNAKIQPLTIKFVLEEEPKWIFEVQMVVQTKYDPKYIIWPNTPKIKRLFDSFEAEGFEMTSETNEITVWENEESRIEYYQLPIHNQLPFLLIKSFDGDMDFEGRDTFGEFLQDKLKRQGILEELTFYRANMELASALDKLKLKNKMPADQLLSNSIQLFQECDQNMYTVAQVEVMFCAWLKSRIALLVDDSEVKYRSFLKIARTMKELRAYEHLKWFLTKIYNEEDKKMAAKIMYELFPFNTLDKHYYLQEATYKTFFKLWTEFQNENRPPEGMHISEWYYLNAKKAQEIGLKELATKNFKSFCKQSERNMEYLKWAVEGTDSLLEFAMDVNATREYYNFSRRMSEYYRKRRSEQRIGNLDPIGRKSYNWTVFTWGMAETRWAFHAAFIYSKQEKKDKSVIMEYYKQAYESFSETLLYYDPTATYLDHQLSFIAQSFLTAYHMYFSIRDEEMVNYIKTISKELLEMHPLQSLYDILGVIFTKSEREEITDTLINSWIESIVEIEGQFSLDFERTKHLIKLYISVEEWEEAANTLLLACEEYHITYESLDELYVHYRTIEKFSPEHAMICEERIAYWLDYYQNQTEQTISYIPTLITRINKIAKL